MATTNRKGAVSIQEVAPSDLWEEAKYSKTGNNPCQCVTRTPEMNEPGVWAFQIGCAEGKHTRRVFSQGHDARLKGYWVRAHRAGVTITVTSADGTKWAKGTPLEFAAVRNWEKFLLEGKEAAKAAARLGK